MRGKESTRQSKSGLKMGNGIYYNWERVEMMS